MAPKIKGGNSKKESGRAKKAENDEKKAAAAADDLERKEAQKWLDGSKTAKDKEAQKEEKRLADLARRAAAAQQLAEEEASASSKPKAAPKAGAKKAVAQKKDTKPAGPGAIAAGGGLGAQPDEDQEEPKEIESYAATGIDNALDLLEVVTAKVDKASIGAKAADIERHPERRFKAAYEVYKERELPLLKEEHPGLRLNQYQKLLRKNFEKSTENPFNQTTVAYDASKEERIAALQQHREKKEAELREP